MSPRTERLLERARALVAEPNNMDVRTRFLAATFNIDRLAAVLVEIDQSRPQSPSDGSETTKTGNSGTNTSSLLTPPLEQE